MPVILNEKRIFSLREVTLSIQKTITERYKSSYWIKAEMNKLNFYPHSGHCYPDLVEKENNTVVAQIRANLWKSDYLKINSNFLKILKEPLKDGINILFCAHIQYDPVHGLTLRIIDIDPGFSLGELEKEKQETIERLKEKGIFSQNKSLTLPLLPKRIAIISVETSKGLADFRKVIDTNPWNYKFFYMLFPSLLQGEKSIDSIINQLNNIKKAINHFDVVAIIRGGGGDIGLSSYNNYLLSREIALFPIPVFTGIGHSTNETVCEMVSFHNAITPTELADYFIQKFHNFSIPLTKAEEKIIETANKIITDEKNKFTNTLKIFKTSTNSLIINNRSFIQRNAEIIITQSNFTLRNKKDELCQAYNLIKKSTSDIFVNEKNKIYHLYRIFSKDISNIIYLNNLKLNTLDKNIEILNPENVLKRGYSITLFNGKALKSTDKIIINDKITTLVADGEIISTVEKINILKNE